jgi:hypothetical protein
MKKYLFLLTLFGFFFVAGCTKDNSTYDVNLTGKVLEIDSDIAIPNMDIKLLELDYNPNTFNATRTTISQTKSDAKGNYQFKYAHNAKYDYEVIAYTTSKNYYDNTQTEPVPDGKNPTVNIAFIVYGWVKIHFKNINPFDDKDEVGCSFGNFIGSKVDTTILKKEGGSKKTVLPIRIWTTRNSLQTYKDIGVIIPPHDTTKLDIFY